MDLKLYPTPDGAVTRFIDGRAVMEQGLENAVYLSLFGQDWWGNDVSSQYERLTSRLPVIRGRTTLHNSDRVSVIETAERALAWMVELGVAKSVVVEGTIRTPTTMELLVKFEQPTIPMDILQYQVNWNRQKEEFSKSIEGKIIRTQGTVLVPVRILRYTDAEDTRIVDSELKRIVCLPRPRAVWEVEE